MKEFRIGYTQGVYDMFHVGHLNLINHAKEYCDYLIVGVNSDLLVQSYKHKLPVISELERAEIVSNIKAVDRCIVVSTLDKVQIWKQLKFNAVFIGDDWKGTARWEDTESELQKYNVHTIFLPYTRGISSTKLRLFKDDKIRECMKDEKK